MSFYVYILLLLYMRIGGLWCFLLCGFALCALFFVRVSLLFVCRHLICVRVSCTATLLLLLLLFCSLVMSIVGGEAGFRIPRGLLFDIKQGIACAARSRHAWIISNGAFVEYAREFLLVFGKKKYSKRKMKK